MLRRGETIPDSQANLKYQHGGRRSKDRWSVQAVLKNDVRSGNPTCYAAAAMLIKRLKVSGLLSFGPEGIDLPMHRLNVLIGPNGSGKSNFLSIIDLLRSSTIHLDIPIHTSGGIDHWLWKYPSTDPSATKSVPGRVEVLVHVPSPDGMVGLRHTFELSSYDHRLDVSRESIENEYPTFDWPDHPPFWFYRFENGRGVLQHHTGAGGITPLSPENLEPRNFERSQLDTGASILSQIKDPGLPEHDPFAFLQSQYSRIRLYRDWTFGSLAPPRGMHGADERTDSPAYDGSNLALLLGTFPPQRRRELIKELNSLYEDITDFYSVTSAGKTRLFVEEQHCREIPSERLSDGTLRFLFLLAILLDPNPPPMIVIEEPELGLHPDVIPKIAELLKTAAERTQLVVTTHSRMLIDALSDDPESVIVCSKENGETRMERLSVEDLSEWLERYSLGDLWSRGEIGGNRW